MKPYEQEPFFEKGRCLFQLNRYQGAIESYKRVLVLNPTSAKAATALGDVFSSSGQWESALDAYITAQQIDPQHPEIYKKLAVAITTLHKNANAEERLDLFEHLLKFYPTTAEYHYLRGLALHQLGHHQEALESFDEALALNPTYAEAQHGKQQAQSALAHQIQPAVQADQTGLAAPIEPKKKRRWPWSR